MSTHTLLISYDLNRPGQNYADLIEAIKSSFPTYWHNLTSTWLIRTTSDPVSVRDFLVKFIDANDKLIVITVGPPGAWSAGFSESAAQWLLDHL